MLMSFVGNGTEEIIRKYKDPTRLFFFSIHLFDKEEVEAGGNEFFPGSGMSDDTVSVSAAECSCMIYIAS